MLGMLPFRLSLLRELWMVSPPADHLAQGLESGIAPSQERDCLPPGAGVARLSQPRALLG